MDRFDTAPEQALAWFRAGQGAALATVVDTWGSAPRRAGSTLAVSAEGEMTGSVSGGCVEGAVVMEALEAMETGETRLLSYGVSDDDAFAVGLACGGTIRVLVQPVGAAPSGLTEATLADLCAARGARRAVALVTDLEDHSSRVATPDAHADRFRMDRSGVEEDGRSFVAIHNPPLRLLCVGAVHIAQALLPMARIAGFDPVVIDPRPAFASPARFPGERLLDDWPDAAIKAEAPDARTAVVLLTHDPKLDDPALLAALETDVFYIGALGSTRTHAKRTARLAEAGIPPEQIGRIHAPIGLDLGAATPAEIATATLAELIRVLRRGA
ncbi:XdhC family protein [Pseudooceanicola aestuarii]|uniref:XdhC family protein n=1 Tax=Pseudooceanicola aestuarii TaxID=2697319 RepID=UPI0013D415CA|nr:XdhC/CoxI family protein [Pseudooceanicola aestuarii]